MFQNSMRKEQVLVFQKREELRSQLQVQKLQKLGCDEEKGEKGDDDTFLVDFGVGGGMIID